MKGVGVFRLGSILAFFMVVLLSGCSSECEQRVKHEPVPTNWNKEDFMPFAIGFLKDGRVVLLDEVGNVVEPTDVTFPIKATQIESVENISIVQYRGSHVKLVKMGNSWYPMPIPH